MRRIRRGVAALAAVVSATLALSACGGPALPPTVVEGSEVRVAWDAALSSVNLASETGATPGNADVEALTRAQFAREREGETTVDATFGSVRILEESDDSFSVAYDLAEPVWSDGIAVDAADLMLAWAAGSEFFAGDADDDPLRFGSVATGLRSGDAIPTYDEFARRIEVSFSRPVVDWQTALDVAVPAHVVGQRALGIDDPMEAKAAVIAAISERREGDLAKIATLWRDGFVVTGDGGLVPRDMLTLSSGPFRIERIEGGPDDEDQRITLVVNTSYVGEATGAYERIVLQHETEAVLPDDIGERYDIAQAKPTPENFEAIRDLERDDYGVHASNRGEAWMVLARTSGPTKLADPAVRRALLRAIPRSDVIEAGAGAWASEFPETTSAIFPSGTRGSEISREDSGFRELLGASGGKPEEERAAAGVPPRSTVCVLYDVDSPTARRMYEAIRDAVAEGEWIATDCGSEDPSSVAEVGGEWDLLLTTVQLPETPAEIAAQWGTDGAENRTGATSAERDALIERLSRTTDAYEARDVKIEIEKTIVQQMAALPLAMDPVVTVSDRSLEAVLPRSGRLASLTSSAPTWRPAEAEAPADAP
ncbi:ABC transporter substrate-binding protein [Microbacterium sp. gxy059]|uniref:ABC transporter substrate-binding protein n=1 Tax=Microbacterium sp. gxy059 TaxID=2957199 RepID=UPI003D956AAC